MRFQAGYLLALTPGALSLALQSRAASDSLSSLFSCPASSWPQSNVGTPITPQAIAPELDSILASVSIANIEADILKLVSFGTRHTLSDQNSTTRGIGAARDWIASEFRKIAADSNGRMTVEVPSYIQGVSTRVPFPVKLSNVVATLKGSEEPERIHVVSGHYDSRISDVLNYKDDAPGADDDASGVAISLELARAMAKTTPKSTIVFVAVAGEEQNLLGSNFLAQTYKNASANVAAMFTNDIVGSSTADDGSKDPFTVRLFAQGPPLTEDATTVSTRLTIGGENDSPARELGRFVVDVASEKPATNMTVALIYRLDRYLRGGDHSSFLKAGYAAARFTEPNEDFKHQHQDVRVENGVQYGDLPEFVDYEYVARVAKVNGAALWSLAQAPAAPTNVRVNTTALSNDSAFLWTKSKGSGIKGYEVVYRPTAAPLWTHSIFVGDVSSATVDLSKDNVVFGIRAVGTNGYKSPAVLPFPAA